jgi:Flp pilus assembly protein TadG
MGMVDVGWLYNHQLMLTNAAREGARMGALGQTAGQIRTSVKSYLTDSGFTPVPTDAQIAVTIGGGTAQVDITVPVPTLFGLGGPDAQLKGSTKMRTE